MTLPPAIEKTRPLESPQVDTSTLSNYRDFRLVHTTLELKVDFDSKVLRGEVTYELERVSDTKKVMLDSSELVVQKVFIDDEEARFNFDEKLAILGSRLVIEPENGKLAEKFKLRCCYETMAGGSAIQWLDEHQTSGQKYVYNQLEPIHGRAFVPSFDTPAVKSTLNVRISSPHRVVFSGIEDEDSGLDGVYSFTQRIPIPTYLFGFASGDIVSADLGPRTKVFAEPHLLEDATKEFTGDVERFIDIAEDLIFEYEWGNYSILVNPSSYPFGGMEYPNITFATPTIVTRDKSNIDVIAHELAHSWSGNLVTNASWGHMWLNEGWTVYLERRITGVVHGEPTRHLAFLVGLTNLQLSLESLENKSLTRLINTADETVNPDDLIQLTAYEKGSCFLFHLENALGGTTAFDPFIKHYFKKFAGKSLDSWQFLDTLFEFFEAKRDILDSIDWETWLFGTGMPPSQKFITNLADEVYALAEKWFANAGKFSEASQFEQEFSISDISHFNIDQLQMFLNSIAQSSSKTDPSFSWSDYPVAAQAFLNIYGDIILHSHNAEIVYRTFLFQIIAHIESSYQPAAEWLGTVGRIKYVRPLYIALASADRQLALDTYSKYRNTYHPICQAAVENSLGIK